MVDCADDVLVVRLALRGSCLYLCCQGLGSERSLAVGYADGLGFQCVCLGLRTDADAGRMVGRSIGATTSPDADRHGLVVVHGTDRGSELVPVDVDGAISFGAGEAGAFPGMSRAVYSWIPMKERGRVQAINFSGSRIGAAVTLPLITWLLVSFGWRSTFVVLMAVGFVWSIVWFLFFRDDPSQAGWLSEEERDYIISTRQQSSASLQTDSAGSPQAVPTQSLFKSRTMWALCGQYFASNFIFFFALSWFFPQLKARYGLTGLEASLFAAAPLICGAFGCWTSGWWVDRLYSSNRWVLSRRLPAMTGFLLAAVGIIGSAFAETPLSSSIWFSLSIFGADMTLPPSWSTCVDVGRTRAGVISGTMNMAGNFGSFITSLAFPYLLVWTGSPLPYFFVAAGLNVLAIGLWMLADPTESLDGSPADSHA